MKLREILENVYLDPDTGIYMNGKFKCTIRLADMKNAYMNYKILDIFIDDEEKLAIEVINESQFKIELK